MGGWPYGRLRFVAKNTGKHDTAAGILEENMKNYCLMGLIVSALLMFVPESFAGRPLSVDDASINDAGAGHVEVWYARMPGKTNTWNVAPAYAPIKDVEVSAMLSRDATGEVTSSAAQVKWRITPSNPAGCNVGMTVGISHTSKGGGNTPFLNGLASCNHTGGALHLNLGISNPDNSKSLTNWGAAYERDFSVATGHIEVFGQEAGKPTTQVGLRKDLVPGLQLDGTVGRSDGETVFSLGLKKSF